MGPAEPVLWFVTGTGIMLVLVNLGEMLWRGYRRRRGQWHGARQPEHLWDEDEAARWARFADWQRLVLAAEEAEADESDE